MIMGFDHSRAGKMIADKWQLNLALSELLRFHHTPEKASEDNRQLVSVVAVADLTRRGREFMAANFNPIETWTMVALLYLIMTLFAARIVSFIEKKTRYER